MIGLVRHGIDYYALQRYDPLPLPQASI
jgi:hypothetical protein